MSSSKANQSLAESIKRMFVYKNDLRLLKGRSLDDWAFKQMWHDYQQKNLRKLQKIDIYEHQRVGSDYAVSKFVLNLLRGSILDQRGIWIKKFREMPPTYDKNFKVVAINASSCRLMTEGVDNFVGLDYCEYLDLRNNPALDEFACDQLARQFRSSTSLLEIDLSFNPRISVYGLEALMRIPSIKRIVAIDTLASKFEEIDLFVMAAEDEKKCEVLVHSSGQKYKSQELEDMRVDTRNKRIESEHH